MAADDKAWFAPKRYGYGAGAPIAWQGWLVTALAAAGFAAAAALLHGPWRALVGGGVLLAFVAIAALKTRGGWRWRRGEDA